MTDLDFKLWFEKNGGWLLIFLFCLIPIILWAIINDLSSEFVTSYGTFSSLGKLFGLIGFVLYAINLLLAVRHRWFENFFQGLNRVYIAHHITGGLALAFVLFHPLFLTIRYIDLKAAETFGDAAVFLWIRSINTSLSYIEFQDAIAVNAGIIAFWGMVVLLIITFFVKLPYRFWLFTHRFLGVAFIFALLHIIFITSDTSQSLMLKSYLVLWGIIGLAAYMYRTVFGSVFVRRTPYKVVKVVSANTITRIELSPLGKKMDFKSGQFVFIRFLWSQEEGVIPEVHPFSIASSPHEDTLRLYVKALGDFTSSVGRVKTETIAEVEGAFGRFVPARYGNASQVWIAGGIGITPFLSMARNMQDLPQKIYLIYSVRTRSEMVEFSVLKDFLSKNFKNFTFIPYITDEEDGKFLDAKYIEEKVGGFAGKEIFICGPPPMMKSMKQQIRSKNVPRRRIHSEEFAMT